MAGAREFNSEFSFTVVVRGFHTEWGYHILGQRLSAAMEHGNTEDHFVIPVSEHSDTRADEDVHDRPIVGHLPRELGKVLCYFLLQGGVLECKVTGRRQHSPLDCCLVFVVSIIF